MIAAANWLKRNLFPNWPSSVLTLLMLGLFALAIPPLLRWAITDATIDGATRAACGDTGACWTFIKVRFDLFFYGRYPATERWRVHAAILVLVVSFALALKAPARFQGLAGLALLTVVPAVVALLLVGGGFGLAYVPTNAWGGLMLNVLLTLVAGVGGFVLGIVLAFGRRSRLPVVRWLSVFFIEIWRGVPLLTVLFMAMLLVPLFMPRGVTVDNLVRAMLALTLFTGAYMAEIVRGGLQAVPQGQVEAARALGLRPWAVQIFVVLPQALRLVIPGIANTVIDLFKDTTLVSIVGLFDLLGVVNQAQKDQAWLGMAREGYTFAAIVFFVSCFALSMLSRLAERQGAQDVRRRS